MNISKLCQMIEKAPVYLYDDIEEACLKVFLDNREMKCMLKHKGRAPVEVSHTYTTAFDIMLGGKEITEKEYKDF